MYKQLPLRFEPREVYSFDTFVSGDNALAVGMLQQVAEPSAELQIYLWAEQGQGKSHLLQAACNLASKRQLAVCYLPAAEIIGQPIELLDGLEQLDLVCLDDVDQLAQSLQWEEALFNLINRMRASKKTLLMTASVSPENLSIALPDLRSRIVWGPVFQLNELADEQKRNALKLRAQQRGLELPDNVVDYLMRHYPRDLFALFERLETLDVAAMAMQRKLTVPFVKTVFEQSSA